MKQYLFTFIFLLFGLCLTQAQVDSINVLPEVTVKDNASSTNYIKNNPSQTLSEILSTNSNIALRNYGPGSLATFSLRGHSSSQTDIILDGFSIRSSMNGVYDLSLLPTFMVQESSIQSSASSAAINGGIGGVLNVHTNLTLNNNKKLSSELYRSYGSFKDSGYFLGNTFRWKKGEASLSNIKVFLRSSENDFSYRNLNVAGTPKVKLQNADFRQYGFQQNNSFQINSSNTLETKFWYINNYRQLPPTLTQVSSSNFQEDELLNGILNWKRKWSDKFDTKISGRYSYEHIYYDSPVVVTDSKARKYDARLEMDYKVNEKHLLSSALGNEYATAQVDDYEDGIAKQNNTFVNLSYQYKLDQFSIKTNIKEEMTDGDLSPILLATDIHYQIISDNISFSSSFNFSRNYRRPTFNDLFWGASAFSVGNPDLSPEKGWKEELNLSLFHEFQQTNIRTGLSLFNSDISNWIQWTPDNTGQWSPQNLRKVNSKGLESSLEFNAHLNDFSWSFSSGYSYTKTTNKKADNSNQNNLNKQLIYVPLHSGNVNLEVRYKKLQLRYNHFFNGKRFTLDDNSDFIPKYDLGNLSISYTIDKEHLIIEPIFEIRNIFNEEYQSVANRPTPPIHFQGTIRFNFIQ